MEYVDPDHNMLGVSDAPDRPAVTPADGLAKTPVVSIIMPVFNEEATLAQVVAGVVAAVPHPLEILIVDDGSTDGTKAVATSLAAADARVKLFRHPSNRGKTAALATGIAQSRGRVVVVQDADFEYTPADLPRLIEPIVGEQAEVVYGSRFLRRERAPMVYYRQHAANRLLTKLSNVATGGRLSDVETGYKAFRGDIIRSIEIASSGFGFEVEITAKIARLGCSVREIPISYHGRTYAQGKKIGFRDFVASVWFIFYFNVRSGGARGR